MDTSALASLIETTLDDNKAIDITDIDIRELTDFTDRLIICTARSTVHAKALSDKVARAARKAGVKPLGIEGEQTADWILIDLQDIIVHIMLAEQREFYSLEKLWTVAKEKRETASNA